MSFRFFIKNIFLRIIVAGNRQLTYQILKCNSYFWHIKSLYPPKGLCESRTQLGTFDSLSLLLLFREGFLMFQNRDLKSAFLKSWNYFIPRRERESKTEDGESDYILCLIPRREPAGSRARRWSNCFYSLYIICLG